jgi:hypothetical protein
MDSYLQQVGDAISSATAGMSKQHLQWHPEGKWSAAMILEHLWLTYCATTIALDRCLRVGRTDTTKPTFSMLIYAFVVLKFAYLPAGRPAPPGTIPNGTPLEIVMAGIPREIVAMDELILRCEERFGSREKLADNPVLGPLTGMEWRKFHWLHARHHARQIERLKQTLFRTQTTLADRSLAT